MAVYPRMTWKTCERIAMPQSCRLILSRCYNFEIVGVGPVSPAGFSEFDPELPWRENACGNHQVRSGCPKSGHVGVGGWDHLSPDRFPIGKTLEDSLDQLGTLPVRSWHWKNE